jgi:DNA polymerase III subunit delta
VKITGARLSRFLRDPDPAIGFALIHGPDRGLVRERVEALTRSVAGDLDDPFRVVRSTAAAVKADPAKLADEMAALSFSGGRRVVRIDDATDGLTAVLKEILNSAGARGNHREDAFVVVEGGELGPRSSLRRLFEGSDAMASLACYGDEGKGLESVISGTLGELGLAVSPDALAFLSRNLGADRMVTRSELDKLALYKGGSGTIELEDAQACVGDSASVTLDAIVYGAAGGDQASLERALERAFAEGIAPVAVLRTVAGHLRKLHLVAARIAKGDSPDRAMGALKPPVIYKFQGQFRAQVAAWKNDRLVQAMEILTEAEIDCKSTGIPPEPVCRRALMRIAQAAKRSGTGRRAR